uniref:Flowering time control protein FCA-like n=1 Tax=Rhizophora mucronata TaxID=61149 RepID=A0A2P2LRP1_RHIMU
MDRHRGGGCYGGSNNYNVNNGHAAADDYDQDSYPSRRSSRFSDVPTTRYSDDGANLSSNYNRRSFRNYRGGDPRSFESPPRGANGGGFRPIDGGGFGPNSREPLPQLPRHSSLSGHKRGFGRGSPGGFAKLFVGSVPRTVTEADIQPLFEECGNVIEVALIKDKRTGQQQVTFKCYFIF